MAIKVEENLPLKPKRSKHHKIIQKNMDYLCTHTTNLSKLTLTLVSSEVMQLELRDEIMGTAVELEQYYKLYSHVSRKNDASFRHLLDALRKSGNFEVLHILQQSLESGFYNVETPDGFPDNHQSFPDVPRRNFKDIRKRDILRFCFWGFGTVSLVIISVMLIVKHFQGSGSSGSKLFTTVPAGINNSTKIHEVSAATPSNNGFIPTSPLLPPTGFTEQKDSLTLKPGIPENSNKFLSIQINSPFKAIPVLDDPETKLNLTISPTRKYDWRTWQIANPDQVYFLALRGSFNETDIKYLFRYFKNLRKLSISNGSYLCEEAKFLFFDGTSSSAAKTLRNFSEATPFMSRFQSNIACPNVEPKILANNWRHLRSSVFDFCED
ncbi:unnamed protein product [Allacma fusca]|uniref:Uncharacterized protein n=1 Tax=Allacma fusca TaxID=39272 RepID=A0A8J2KSL4_9HEXA|nr:unnamed protein product [Allacma fusca]